MSSPEATNLDDLLPDQKRQRRPQKMPPVPPMPGTKEVSGEVGDHSTGSEFKQTMEQILKKKTEENAHARRQQELLSTPPDRQAWRSRRGDGPEAVSRTPPAVRKARDERRQRELLEHQSNESFLAEGEDAEWEPTPVPIKS